MARAIVSNLTKNDHITHTISYLSAIKSQLSDFLRYYIFPCFALESYVEIVRFVYLEEYIPQLASAFVG